MNVGGVISMSQVGNNYAKLSRDYTSLSGKPFLEIEDVVVVENWLLHHEKIFVNLGLDDKQKRRLASR